MLENLRRKSLVKTYNDPIHQVHFEQGLARYENHVEIGVCTQKLYKKVQKMSSKDLQESSFKKAIDTISVDTRVWLRFNMICCPSGTFIMGHKDEKDNQPRKETIERPFLLGETEITQELYQAVMGYNFNGFRNRSQNPIENVTSQNPVEKVSWVETIKFCNELSKLHGLELCYTENQDSLDYGWDCDFSKNGYRLPEEKEWEYAAKAGTENEWAGTNDKDKLDKYAWFGEDWRNGGSTHPVKTKKPNEWGFYDMSGNVWEWCWDKYNPKGGASVGRVLRGGSWSGNTSHLRSAYRSSSLPGLRGDNLGFRVCRSIIN